MAQDVTLQLTKAVSYMHARGIMHRDLKPEVCFSSHLAPQMQVVESHILEHLGHAKGPNSY